MNCQIFIDLITKRIQPSQILESIICTDLLGSVLRSHLICENLVEAWVCAACSQADLFGDENNRIVIEFETKLRIARNVGLPKSIYESFKIINRIRNNLAHNLHLNDICQKHIDSLYDNINNYMIETDDTPLQKCYMNEFDENGMLKQCYLVTDKSTPNQKKLSIIVLTIFRKVMSTVVKHNTSRSTGDFTMK